MDSKYKSTPRLPQQDKLPGLTEALEPAHSISSMQGASISPALDHNQAEQIIRAIMGQVVVGFSLSDLAGHITFVNDCFCKIVGYSREELLGRRWLELTHPDDRSSNIEFFRQMTNSEKPFTFEKRYVRKNGEVIWVSVGPSQIRDADGELVGGAAIVVDITDCKQSVELLKQSTEEIKDLYNNAPCGYHSLDKNGNILRINDTELAWLGYRRDEVIGKMKWSDLLTSGSQQAFSKDFPHFKKQGFVRDFEIELIRKDGTVMVGLVNASAIYDPGGHYVMSRSTIIDITERKRHEKIAMERRNEMAELQNMHVAAQTAAAFAHELNQPLLAIASYSKAALMLLQDEKTGLEKARTAIKESERQAHRAGQSIRQLLELLTIKEFPTEAFDLIKEISAILSVAKLEYELQFHAVLQLEEGIPKIRANRTHIQKVILNLLHNSIEATRHIGLAIPTITLNISAIKEKNLVQMTFKDNGPGFKQENIERLFEPFFTTKARGVGMGLSISRSLIEANGGQLWVEPKEGPGATFHLTLPFAT